MRAVVAVGVAAARAATAAPGRSALVVRREESKCLAVCLNQHCIQLDQHQFRPLGGLLASILNTFPKTFTTVFLFLRA